MNRMALIAIALCTVLLVTVGVGIVTAAQPQTKLPPKFRVVQFDVNYGTDVVGKLSVNTNQWTYVMNAHGLEPGEDYYFYYLGKYPPISNATANKYGDVHMKGMWPEGVDVVMSTPEFILTDLPLMGRVYDEAVLTCNAYYGLFRTKLWGSLTSPGGTPLPDQPLKIYNYNKIDDDFGYAGDTKTDADGTYLQGMGLNLDPFWVSFSGGEYNGTWYYSTNKYCTPRSYLPAL